MRVCIVGAKGRDTEADRVLVCQLIEQCAVHYPYCLFVSLMTHVGIGQFVKEKCLEKDRQDRYKFPLVDVHTKVYGADLVRDEQTAIFLARNAAVAELGDIFYYLAMRERRGTMEDLIARIEIQKKPYKVFLPGDVIELI